MSQGSSEGEGSGVSVSPNSWRSCSSSVGMRKEQEKPMSGASGVEKMFLRRVSPQKACEVGCPKMSLSPTSTLAHQVLMEAGHPEGFSSPRTVSRTCTESLVRAHWELSLPQNTTAKAHVSCWAAALANPALRSLKGQSSLSALQAFKQHVESRAHDMSMEDDEENSGVRGHAEGPSHFSRLRGRLSGPVFLKIRVACQMAGLRHSAIYLLKRYSGCFHGNGLGMRLIFKWVDSEKNRWYILI